MAAIKLMELTYEKIPEEEAYELHMRARSGDIEARNRIVEANLALAGWYQEQFGRRHALDPQSVVAAATYGLIVAAERHDPRRGTKFATTAFYWMRKHAKDDEQAEKWIIRTPIPFRRDPAGYTAKTTDRTTAKKALERLLSARFLGDEAVAEATDGKEREDRDRDLFEDQMDEVKRRLSLLYPHYRRVVEMRYGLNGHEPQHRDQIAETLGVTKKTVSTTVGAALRQMREMGDATTGAN